MKASSRIRRWFALARLWFSVGIGVKRWLFVLGLGTAIIGVGITYLILILNARANFPRVIMDFITLQFIGDFRLRILVTMLVGLLLMTIATLRLGANLIAPFVTPDEDVVQSLYNYRNRQRGPRIVAIGGGTGMPSLLRGLTEYTRNITAIVTVADDGGSSGRLRKELGLLPPGDFRNNIAALARDEALMTQLMQYRFGESVEASENSDLSGHAFGNLVLAALTGITGSFDEALLAMDKVLAMRGRVMPSTLSDVALSAEITKDSKRITVHGESAIPKAGGKIERVMLDPTNARAYPPAVQAILQADLIVMGPGSLYTSVLPNLLVGDLAQALRHARAPKIYVCNVAIQPGETDDYSVAEHVDALVEHTYAECIDYVLANDNFNIAAGVDPHETVFVEMAQSANVETRYLDLIDDLRPWRHDSNKVAAAVVEFLDASKR